MISTKDDDRVRVRQQIGHRRLEKGLELELGITYTRAPWSEQREHYMFRVGWRWGTRMRAKNRRAARTEGFGRVRVRVREKVRVRESEKKRIRDRVRVRVRVGVKV